MQKTTVPIKGMHCRSCELLIEDELTQIQGVTRAEVSEKKACAIVHFENTLNATDVEAAVKKAGYEVGFNVSKPWFSKKLDDYIDIFYSLFALAVLYVLVNILGLTKLFASSAGHPTNLVTVLVIGLTAGFSTCMALIGGLILGVSARFSEVHPQATGIEKFKPHLFFNAGRILSYTFFGGVIGLIGSMFQLSGFSLGMMTLAVALVMLTLGLQLTGLFPRLENFKLTLPASIGKILGIKDQRNQEYSHKNAFIMGATTFFLPCGFTQAMQLYAISTGNFFLGAAIMGVFALGTTPGLLGIGTVTSLVKGIFAQKFFKFAGVVVVTLSLFNLNNGLNLIGFNPTFLLESGTDVLAATSDTIAPRQGEVQIVKMTQSASGYAPNNFTIVKGVPVKWIINSTDPNSCASSILSSKIGVRQNLHPGENVIEFTPKEIGTIGFSCMMGMFRGSFTVTLDNGNPAAGAAEVKGTIDTQVAANPAGGTCGGGGGGCGCGGGARKQVNPDTTPAPAVVENSVQVLKTTYTTANDITPNTFSIKKGKPVRFEIDVKDEGFGCMSSIMISRLSKPQFLEKGKTLVFEFTPDKSGEYPITCAMGVPRGSIKVI